LKEVRRTLKKGGILLLGTVNRYWLLHWLGMKDPYSGFPFMTIMPRKVADSVCKLKERYRFFYLERVYSYFELNDILSKAGFKVVSRLTALPGWGYHEKIADLDDGNDVIEKIESIDPWNPFVYRDMTRPYNLNLLPKTFWRIIHSLGLMKILCSNFIYVCTV